MAIATHGESHEWEFNYLEQSERFAFTRSTQTSNLPLCKCEFSCFGRKHVPTALIDTMFSKITGEQILQSRNRK